MSGGQHGYRLQLARDPSGKRTYALWGEGTPVGWLQLGVGRSATVTVDGDCWDLTQRGWLRHTTYVVSRTTRQHLAQLTGTHMVVSGGLNLVLISPAWKGGPSSFVRSDGVTVVRFSELKGLLNHSLEIDLMGGDWHVDLLCAFVGSWMTILRARQGNGGSVGMNMGG